MMNEESDFCQHELFLVFKPWLKNEIGEVGIPSLAYFGFN